MNTMGLHSKVIAIIIGISMLAAAHCVRAAGKDRDSITTELPSALLLAAELDPAFQQKLVLRVRGPYERSHQLNLWASAY